MIRRRCSHNGSNKAGFRTPPCVNVKSPIPWVLTISREDLSYIKLVERGICVYEGVSGQGPQGVLHIRTEVPGGLLGGGGRDRPVRVGPSQGEVVGRDGEDTWTMCH